MPKQDFGRIAIPRDLHEAIVKHIRKNPQLGYLSVSELIRAAVRDARLGGRIR